MPGEERLHSLDRHGQRCIVRVFGQVDALYRLQFGTGIHQVRCVTHSYSNSHSTPSSTALIVWHTCNIAQDWGRTCALVPYAFSFRHASYALPERWETQRAWCHDSAEGPDTALAFHEHSKMFDVRALSTTLSRSVRWSLSPRIKTDCSASSEVGPSRRSLFSTQPFSPLDFSRCRNLSRNGVSCLSHSTDSTNINIGSLVT
jgi:hypothetical protein